MTLTSNQYKQLLFQMLRRLFSRRTCNDYYENATVYKIGSMLNDPSVVVQQSNYEELKEFFDRQIQYCYDEKIYNVSAYYQDKNFDTNFAEWQGLMANLGIDISIGGTLNTDLIVVMPDGTESILSSDYFTPWYINTKQGTSYKYASLSDSYKYKYDIDDLPDLSDDDYKVINSRCKWSYEEDTNTVSIYGSSSLCDDLRNYFNLVLGCLPTTIIINAGINKFGKLLVSKRRSSAEHVDIIYLGAADEEIILPEEHFIEAGCKLTYSDGSYDEYYTDVTIYTDNKIMNNYNYPSNGTYTTITIKSLSEWQG